MTKERRESLPIPIPGRKNSFFRKRPAFSLLKMILFSPKEEKTAKTRKEAARLMEEGIAALKKKAEEKPENGSAQAKWNKF